MTIHWVALEAATDDGGIRVEPAAHRRQVQAQVRLESAAGAALESVTEHQQQTRTKQAVLGASARHGHHHATVKFVLRVSAPFGRQILGVRDSSRCGSDHEPEPSIGRRAWADHGNACSNRNR
jgi:hypothetical protein